MDRAARLAYLRDLFDEAAVDAELSPARAERENAFRLLFCVFHIQGTLNLERGWIDEFLRVLREAGLGRPARKTVRWYRSQVAQNPVVLEYYSWSSGETLADLFHQAG